MEGQSSLCKAHLNLAKKASQEHIRTLQRENEFTQPQQSALYKQVCYEMCAIFMGKCKLNSVSLALYSMRSRGIKN